MPSILALLLLLSTAAFAQDDPARLAPEFDPDSIDYAEGMKTFQRSMQPSAQHEMLRFMEGEWDMTTRMWMGGPDSEPSETTGESINTFELGGRFLVTRSTGTMMGMPIEEMSILGFDNFAHEYQLTMMNTMTTAMLRATGHASQDGRSIVLYGTMDEMMMGITDRTVRWVFTANDADTFTLEVHDLHIDVDDNKVVEVVYRRKTP